MSLRAKTMKPTTLKNRMLVSFFAVIAVLGLFMGLLGFYVIDKDIIQKARKEVKEGLRAARSEYVGKIVKIHNGVDLVSPRDDLDVMRDKIGLDYLYYAPESERSAVRSEIAQRAFAGVRLGGTRIIPEDELREMAGEVYREVEIEVRPTPMARPSDKRSLTEAMAIEYAMPVDSAWGQKGVLYGGRIINNDFQLVDKIRDLTFGSELYDSKPVGTVTIFQDDVRVATNVLDNTGLRAVGTRISDSVYKEVVESGGTWWDRAFVVTDWYLTAYEPIKDIDGRIIGVLYVGILEKPYVDMARNILIVFVAIISLAVVLAVFLSFVLTAVITRHVGEVVDAADKMARGDLDIRVETRTGIRELDILAGSFNNMTENLSQSQAMLKIWNEKLAELNKNYLDLIGFVSHELKGILASTTLNAYSVRDGFLGMVNFKQRKALDSITRNLDYLAATVKNFLNLSRIEKGEVSLNRADVMLKEDIFDPSLESLHRQAVDKGMEVVNNIPAGMAVNGDPDLLTIVANNLAGNAIKYGAENGKVIISAFDLGGSVRVEVYNDGRPVTEEEKGRLFKRFSRLAGADGKKVRGTGLGLFITKDIIEKHGGAIRVEPRENGNAFVFEIKKG